jgi:hypothetical protein
MQQTAGGEESKQGTARCNAAGRAVQQILRNGLQRSTENVPVSKGFRDKNAFAPSLVKNPFLLPNYAKDA